jgi:hypothetical protein
MHTQARHFLIASSFAFLRRILARILVGLGGPFERGGVLDLALEADKVSDGAVVGALGLWWEKAGGQFPHALVVEQALTALALARAGFVGAVASCQVLVYIAFHILPPMKVMSLE